MTMIIKGTPMTTIRGGIAFGTIGMSITGMIVFLLLLLLFGGIGSVAIRPDGTTMDTSFRMTLLIERTPMTRHGSTRTIGTGIMRMTGRSTSNITINPITINTINNITITCGIES